MVMVWLAGGQGKVRGACAPSPPQHPNLPHLDPPPPTDPPGAPPPLSPSWTPPPLPLPEPLLQCPPPPPPQGASGQQLIGEGSRRPKLRGRPPPVLDCSHTVSSQEEIKTTTESIQLLQEVVGRGRQEATPEELVDSLFESCKYRKQKVSVLVGVCPPAPRAPRGRVGGTRMGPAGGMGLCGWRCAGGRRVCGGVPKATAGPS